MGASESADKTGLEVPSQKHTATLYYFAGRGLADQIRWMLAATNIDFTQKMLEQRSKLVKMAEKQLPFGQLPLLQIDGFDLVQSQAIVRYLARRAKIAGDTPEEEVKCDMIAEATRDLVSIAAGAPFARYRSKKEGAAHIETMKTKWEFISSRFELILEKNSEGKREFMVGSKLTYADILVAHITTWYVEECGPEIVENTPLICELQNKVISLPGVQHFIKSLYYFPPGDDAYVEVVNHVLDRKVAKREVQK